MGLRAARLLAALAATVSLARGQLPELELSSGERAPALGWTSEVWRLGSDALEEEVRLFVGKPPSFARAQQPFPALVLLDGQYYFAEVLAVVADLAANGHMPAPVLIGIESRDRRTDFTPPEVYLPDVEGRARAGKYLDFLEHELVPAAEAQLKAGRPRVLLGHSHAGMLALYAVAQRPAAFPWVVAVDAPTHHEQGFLARDVARMLGVRERPPVRLVSVEVVFGFEDDSWRRVQALARPGDLLSRASLEGESHASMLFPAAYRGLHELFADSSLLATDALAPLEIDMLFRDLAPLYGAELVPSEEVMRRVVEDFLLEGRGERAGVWLARSVALYGKPPDYAELAARTQEAAALGDPAETVAGLLALPRATPEEMKDHLGTWKGTTWRGEGRREELTARFWVEDGSVRGELQYEVGPVQALPYLRFRPDGALEFGFRNGIRPRALIVFEERVPGGPLEGDVPFRGIRFTPPPGEGSVPPFHFELERVQGGER